MGHSINFQLPNRCSCESVKVLEPEIISTWGGLETPTFRLMPNAPNTWANRARQLVSHVFEYSLWL